MKILLIMNPGISVPPQYYGGIERIVYLLAEEYHRLGHAVTLLAGSGSHCSGTVITFNNSQNKSRWENVMEICFAWKYLLKNRNDFDLIHNFGRLIYFLPISRSPVFKMMSYQRAVSTTGIALLTRLHPCRLAFTGCSNYCVSTGNVAGQWATVYNAIDFSAYQLKDKVSEDAPFIFLGRLDQIKGAHTAINVAKATRSKLWIAGNIPETSDNYDYYKQIIEPQFDQENIIYLGQLDDKQKNAYLGQAKALLFPIEWDEPFGIVMIEAMACGTPVIAFNRGAVPEVVDNNTGIKVENEAEMIQAAADISCVDRSRCRNTAKKRFNITQITQKYLQVYENYYSEINTR